MDPIKYQKPPNFKGRGLGNKSYKKNKWHCIYYDKDQETMISGKFKTKEHLLEELKLDITPDQIYRLVSGARVDTEKTKKKSSFLSRFGHIKITRIDEPAEN